MPADAGSRTPSRLCVWPGRRRHPLEDEGQQARAHLDLAAAHGETDARQPAQVKPMLLEPLLCHAYVPSHGRTRYANAGLELLGANGQRRGVEEREEYAALAVVASRTAGPRAAASSSRIRCACGGSPSTQIPTPRRR